MQRTVGGSLKVGALALSLISGATLSHANPAHDAEAAAPTSSRGASVPPARIIEILQHNQVLWDSKGENAYRENSETKKSLEKKITALSPTGLRSLNEHLMTLQHYLRDPEGLSPLLPVEGDDEAQRKTAEELLTYFGRLGFVDARHGKSGAEWKYLSEYQSLFRNSRLKTEDSESWEAQSKSLAELAAGEIEKNHSGFTVNREKLMQGDALYIETLPYLVSLKAKSDSLGSSINGQSTTSATSALIKALSQ